MTVERITTADPDRIVYRDASTVASLDAITTKYRSRGKAVDIIGLNQDSAHRHQRLSGHLGAGH